MDISNVIKNSNQPLQPLFSICTIVNNEEQYQEMKISFEKNGFSGDCEYLIIDNIHANTMDAYQGINWFLKEARGEYIIITHQDILCLDSKVHLLEILAHLEQTDPYWAIGGNAGCSRYKTCYFHLVNAGRTRLSKGLPKKVTSLDENFLLVKASRKPSMSFALTGYHLYGTDICINAAREGHSAYVIPFLVNHLSLGNLPDLEKYIPGFLEVHTNSKPVGFVQTTCTKFYLGSSEQQTRFYNSSFMFELVKAWERIKGLFK